MLAIFAILKLLACTAGPMSGPAQAASARPAGSAGVGGASDSLFVSAAGTEMLVVTIQTATNLDAVSLPESFEGSNRVDLCTDAGCTLPWTMELGEGALFTVFAANGVIGDAAFGALPADDDGENAMSLVGTVSWGGFHYLFDGDLTGGGKDTAQVEQFFASRLDPWLPVTGATIGHLGHHGIDSSTSDPWIRPASRSPGGPPGDAPETRARASVRAHPRPVNPPPDRLTGHMLYPEIQASRSGTLKVSALHEIYWEECGNPKGIPAVFVHGGPGAGCDAVHRRFFNPRKYRIILFDQRGCGRSTPHAELRENTTWDLVADMEQLRKHLNVKSWLVFGGSWGSTLALAYAETHPEHTLALVLRGIFLLRTKEIQWFYQQGASWLFPDYWQDYLAPIAGEEHGDLVAAYHRRLTSDDLAVRLEAAKAWSVWEGRTSKLLTSGDMVDHYASDAFALAFARIECHYFVHRGFFARDDQLLADVHKIRHIPGTIVQGRYDVVCPITSAWDLHRAWPESTLHIVADAGHSAFEDGILARLIEATDEMAERLG